VRGFWTGFLLALVILAAAAGFFVASGRVPAAVYDSPLPFEKTIATFALDAHIERQRAIDPPMAPDEATLNAGALVYRNHCAECHGLPGQSSTPLGRRMYPPAPELFKGEGVTDDPVFESYWKVAHGIRLTGMPEFSAQLSGSEMWQVSQLVANANKLPDSVRKVLEPAAK
jgi:thiosulfate dehydrogenase